MAGVPHDLVPPTERLDVRFLRSLVHARGGALKRSPSVGFAVTAAQIAELVLSGAVTDDQDQPLAHPSMAVDDPLLEELLQQIDQLSVSLWSKLFWRQTLNPAVRLESLVESLVSAGL